MLRISVQERKEVGICLSIRGLVMSKKFQTLSLRFCIAQCLMFINLISSTNA